MGLGGGAGVYVKADAELGKRVLDELVIAVADVLGRAALLAGAERDGHAVLVAAAYEQHIALLEAQVADVDVGRHVDAGQMADMHSAVCVGQGGGDQCAFEFLVH